MDESLSIKSEKIIKDGHHTNKTGISCKKSYCLTTFVARLSLLTTIVGGNIQNFNIGGRISFKICEIFYAFSILLFIINKRHNSIFDDKKNRIIFSWCLLSMFLLSFSMIRFGFSWMDYIIAILYLIRFIMYFCYAYFISCYFKEKKQVNSILNYINNMYIIVCFIGFYQLIKYPVAYDFYKILWKVGVYWPNADYHINRMFSTYLDPNYFASCLLIGVSLNLYLKKESKKKSIKYNINLIIYTLSIILSRSRSGMTGLLIIIVIYYLSIINYKRLKLSNVFMFLFIPLVLSYLLFFSDFVVFERIRNVFSDDSALSRFNSWKIGFEMFEKSWFLGIGYNFYGAFNDFLYGITYESSGYANDSSLMLILVDTGLIGLFLYLYHFYVILKDKKIATIFKVSVLSFIIISNFNNLLFYGLWVVPFYTIINMHHYDKKEW